MEATAGQRPHHNLNTRSIAEDQGNRQAAQKALMSLFSTTQETGTADSSSDFQRLQSSAPRWMWFLDEYIDRYKNGILEINPEAKGAQRQIRRLLSELLHDAIEAATEDLNDIFHSTKRGSTASGPSTRGSSPAGDEQFEDAVMGALDISEEQKEETNGDTTRLRALGEIVRMEMEEMAAAAKEAIDDLV